MELTFSLFVTLALVVVFVWYFGTALKATLSGSAEMASAEFVQVRADQSIRHRKQDIKRSEIWDELASATCYTAHDIVSMSKTSTEDKKDK